MLPPVEQAVLDNNPDFAILYSKLTTSILNSDGSTKTDPAAKERRLVSELLRSLEAKHGPIARSLEFRATEASLTAQRQEAEAETALWLARRDTYTPEAARALANYASHLRDAKARLNEAIHTLKGELEAYGVDPDQGATGEGAQGGKEKVMREMARVYRDMNRQLEEVKGDLDRLKRA
ncbi:hypothetical protein NEMBOFW57_004746 [Staphylotrichum longicolle]|uniref:Uncharacterized protein n=1 Tax=Staphylotrichum longicolle TaxID=669026 RepID=A0AAD4FC96_9PEZI|nr:hypothetical protein NEMBOFW57_004746 [Staphylotrichum longicolle]